MAYYNIEKVVTENKSGKKTKYQALVRHKQHGKLLFKRQRTFKFRDAALKWCKEMVYDIEHNQKIDQPALTMITVGELIRQ